MRVVVEETYALSFPDGTPVRAASAIVAFGGGWLVAQDDATHAAWLRGGLVTPVRVVEAIDGLEVFSEVAGTKHLKPDFEAACAVTVGGVEAALLLGSGSSPARMRASLLRLDAAGSPWAKIADLTAVYHAVAEAMGLQVDQLNLEGACVVGDRLRWFQRANVAAGAPTVCADVELDDLLAAVMGRTKDITIKATQRYDLGTVDGVALAVTDAIAVEGNRVLVSAVAEDTPNAIDDGPIVAAALALLEEDDDGEDGSVRDLAEIPKNPDKTPPKIEGLAIKESTKNGVRVVAVTDADDPTAPSEQLTLRVYW
ncbi:DUF6910 family protein [Paractinoplanes globisporus]|uniref:DUF6910 family protein n=1 Tax=Paractinoplanes globisporus TaxID=113565 RepID=A0ABW6WAF0_9ACTN|nr:hypothetical protein [Actinoplanes globisporus]